VRETCKQHWPEYVIEGVCLGLFMISALTFATILEHPASAVHQALPHPLFRRLLMGLAMGGTAIAIVYSPWGKQSGAHINPATTITFFRLGKIKRCDAAFYVASQFTGALLGTAMAALILSSWVGHPAVNYAVTAPGAGGAWPAFLAEVAIAFLLMTVILTVSNHPRLHTLTGLCAGVLVAIYITFEAPISGMSMNPARTFASAVAASQWSDLWIYFTAPVIGMLAASELYLGTWRDSATSCAKLHHENSRRCIFCGKPGRSFHDRAGRKGNSMKRISNAAAMGLAATIYLAGCANLQVAGQVQAGRNALQTGRPHDAVAFLAPAAQVDPDYRLPYRIGESVLTYLGRAYYETGRDKDAQNTLEQALKRHPDDHLARVYLGLARLRASESPAGRQQVEAGLKGLHDHLDYLAADNVYGLFWDPAGTLRSEIRTALAGKASDALWVASVERIGREFDEEIDEARRDEVRTRSRSSGGGD
jgi:aquaporin Z